MIGGLQDIDFFDHLRKYQSERLHKLSNIAKYYCLIGEMFSVSSKFSYHFSGSNFLVTDLNVVQLCV